MTRCGAGEGLAGSLFLSWSPFGGISERLKIGGGTDEAKTFQTLFGWEVGWGGGEKMLVQFSI